MFHREYHKQLALLQYFTATGKIKMSIFPYQEDGPKTCRADAGVTYCRCGARPDEIGYCPLPLPAHRVYELLQSIRQAQPPSAPPKLSILEELTQCRRLLFQARALLNYSINSGDWDNGDRYIEVKSLCIEIKEILG